MSSARANVAAVVADEQDPFWRNERVCPRCGDTVLTLGDRCPNCGRRFERRGTADFIPDLDWMLEQPFGLATLGVLLVGGIVAVVLLLDRI